jgi:hypothetical protein
MRRTVLLLAALATALVLTSGAALAALSEVPDTGTIGHSGSVWSIVAVRWFMLFKVLLLWRGWRARPRCTSHCGRLDIWLLDGAVCAC